MKSQELVNMLPDLNSKGLLLVAIDGCGGAGKSTLATNLATTLANSQIVHIDDFYKPKEERIEITNDTPVHSNFEFDRLKHQVLEPLKQGAVAKYQTPNGQIVEVKPSGYVIVEGLGTLGTELRDYFDYKIWVDVLEAVRRQRGIERDTTDWADIWDNEYLPQDARYVKEQEPQKFADKVLHNN